MLLTNLRFRNFPEDEEEAAKFPWTLPLIKNFDEIVFEKSISFFVGENGSGKSTILEGMAAYLEVPIAGSLRLEDDPSLAAANELANYMSIRLKEKTRSGFFVRAEDFIGFARNIRNEIAELDKEIEEIKESFTGGDLEKAIGTIKGEKDQFIKRYTANMEEMSHGEGFLKFFTSRITGKGIYLIDEPEAALSPVRQLSLLTLILEKVRTTGSHFVIATHSPIFMSVPDSEVFYFSEGAVNKVDYKETEHYQLTKSILDNPEQIMNHIGADK